MFNATLVSVHVNGNLFASSLLTEPYNKNTVYSYFCKDVPLALPIVRSIDTAEYVKKNSFLINPMSKI